MSVILPPEVEKKLLELAAQKCVDPASLIASLVEEEARRDSGRDPLADVGEDDIDPDALNKAVAALINRTPEEKKAARDRAIKEFRPKNELPSDVSPLDVMPVIRGDETDEQVLLALKYLS